MEDREETAGNGEEKIPLRFNKEKEAMTSYDVSSVKETWHKKGEIKMEFSN